MPAKYPQNQQVLESDKVELRGRAGLVCVSEMGRLLPGLEVADFSVEYVSVLIFGEATIVSDLMEARRALRQLEKYFPHLRSGATMRHSPTKR